MFKSFSRTIYVVGVALAVSVSPAGILVAQAQSAASESGTTAPATAEPSTPSATEVAPTAQTDETPSTAPDAAAPSAGADVEAPAEGVSAGDDAAPAASTSEPARSAEPAATGADAESADDAALPGTANGTEAPASAVAIDTLPHELSVPGMFMAADIVVKAVMSLLAFASLMTWTIWLAKTMQITGARGRARRGLNVLSSARTLADAIQAMGNRRGVVAAMIATADEEMRFSKEALDFAGDHGVKERVSMALSRIEARAGRHLAKGTGVLATVGSVAPFVGLFGTVWGIMNSFIGISESQTTNLAVVAPGIAEALLATAIGLVAAIPAVIIYNAFARSVTGYRQLLADAASQIERLVSRDLDFRHVRNNTETVAPISRRA